MNARNVFTEALNSGNKVKLVTAVFVIFFIFNLPTLASTSVVVEGVGEIISGETARARDEAINDAFRRSIEKAIGAYISSETKMENLQVIKDEIYLNSRGYVTDYEILSEEQGEDLYRVEIKAWVKSTPLKKDLARIIKTCSNPKMVVIIEETNLGRKEAFSTIGSSLRSYFQERGFHLVSRSQVKKIKDNVMAKKALEGDMEAATSLAMNFEADIIITGKAYTEFITKKMVRSTEMYSTKAYADLQAIVLQQAQIVASFTKTTTEYDLSKRSAGNKALSVISEKVNEKLAFKVIDAFCTGGDGPARSLQLIITNLQSFSQFMSIKDSLTNTRGVDSVYQRLFDVPVAKLDIDLTIKPQDLAYRLENLKEFNLKITKFTSSKIEVKVAG